MSAQRDPFGWLDTACLFAGAVLFGIALGIVETGRALRWCWRKLADGETAMGLAAGIVAGFVVGVICWDLVGWLEIWMDLA